MHNILIIRTDASVAIGTGHVMRCLALAQAWQKSGGTTVFVLAFPLANLEDRLLKEGFQTIHLDGIVAGCVEDAAETAVIAQKYQAQWIVVDGYQFDADYQRSLKASGFQVLFVDDYGHANYYCADVVLNQNIYAQPDLYANKEPCTQLLLGTKYALLRREFWEWRDWQRPFPERVRNILVTLGGSDPNNVTLTVVQAIKQLAQEDLEVIVLVGAQNSYYAELETAVKQDSRIKLRMQVVNMPELMTWADIAISAGGSTNWELAFMEIPNLIIILADNQIPVAQGLSEAGISIDLGWYEQVKIDEIKEALNLLVTNTDLVQQKRLKGREIVDGYGSQRIVEIMGNHYDGIAECNEI